MTKKAGDAQPSSEQDFAETRELRILYEMAAVLSHSLKLDDLLRDALETIEGLLSIPLSAVYLIEERGTNRSLRLAAFRGFSPEFDVEKLAFDPSSDWYDRCIGETRPHVTRERLDETTGHITDRSKKEGVQSAAMIPLVSRGRVLGLLRVASRAHDKFDNEEIDLLEALGPDLGVAIENAQLFELVQRGRDEWLATFDSVEDRLAVLDQDLVIIRANRALSSALGKSPGEIVGKTCSEIFPDLCADDCPHLRALRGERTETEVETDRHTLRTLTYPTSSGGVIHVAKDVTEAKTREIQLIQSEKLAAASTVLAGVAHELNNPLTVVIAYSDLLTQLEETSAYHEEVQQILRSALRCQSIVRTLLAFSRATPDHLEVDVNQLIHETLPLFSYQLRVGGIRVEERLNPSVPPISGDRNRLQVILVNIINNAHQAIAESKRGSYLRVSTRVRGGNVEIEIEDDGPGIPTDVLPRVFEPFFTTHASRDATGLGLSLSLTIAKDHGGDITVTSEPGRGTTVLISLPSSAAAAVAKAAPAPEPGCLTSRRILFADDEPDVRSLVSAALEMFGAEVVTVANGSDALELLRSDDAFDLIFTDLRMPIMGGDELIQALTRELPHFADRVLLTTGDIATPSADEAIRDSGRPCIAKPFNVRELVGSILKVLAENDEIS